MNKNIKSRYYTPEEILKTNYFQFPKWLMVVDISNESKMLYMILLDRYKLSVKNKWVNEQNQVFSYFSKEKASELLRVGVSTCYKAFKELVDKGFIEQERQGQGKSNKIFLKQFAYDEYFQTYENCMSENEEENEACEKQEFRPTNTVGQDIQKIDTSNNNLSNKEINNSSSSSDNKTIDYLLNEKSSVDGMMVNDKQYQEINSLIRMSPHLKTTKQNIIDFLHKLYDETNNQFKTWDGKQINNLQNFVECSFSRKHNRDQEELRIIKQNAENGDYWAQKIVEERPILYANLES